MEVKGEVSCRIILEFGSPQGSIISHLLFILLVSDMKCNLPGEMVGYWDDTTNIVTGVTVEDLGQKCTESISMMTE